MTVSSDFASTIWNEYFDRFVFLCNIIFLAYMKITYTTHVSHVLNGLIPLTHPLVPSAHAFKWSPAVLSLTFCESFV